MRWLTRLAISVICLGLGTSTWFILAQNRSATRGLSKKAEVMPTAQAPLQADQRSQLNSASSPIKFVSDKPAHGRLNVDTIVLREGAAANSRVVAKVKIDGSYYVDILDSTDDALHVNLHVFSRSRTNSADKSERESAYVGWTDWSSVEPEESMIVLDAGTGAVISRRPVGSMWSPVAYSPDGSRAVFNGPATIYTKCEVRTSDYSIIRCMDAGAESSFFYGPTDGALYAAIQMIGGRFAYDASTWLKIVRIGDEGASTIAAEIPDDVEDLAISPDGRTGFYLHHVDYRKSEMKVDVVDLATFKIRNSFILYGDALPSTSTAFAVNQDGTELYATLVGGVSKVSVIDTRTGETMRTLKFSHAPRESWYITSGDVVGDSLLLNIGRGGHDEPHPTSRNIWLKGNGRVIPEKRFSTLFQAGDFRYALDTYSKQILKLDANNNVQGSLKIDLSSIKKGSAINLHVDTMSASPDGKRILLFVGPQNN